MTVKLVPLKVFYWNIKLINNNLYSEATVLVASQYGTTAAIKSFEEKCSDSPCCKRLKETIASVN